MLVADVAITLLNARACILDVVWVALSDVKKNIGRVETLSRYNYRWVEAQDILFPNGSCYN